MVEFGGNTLGPRFKGLLARLAYSDASVKLVETPQIMGLFALVEQGNQEKLAYFELPGTVQEY